MFVLTVVRDVVRVPADRFDAPLLEVLSEELDKKYSNRVIADVGLCICVQDFKTVEDAIIYPADGGAHHRVVFRLLVFRPFVGEVVLGTISGSNDEGLRISVEFFHDIKIPHFLLPQPSIYDSKAKLWVWQYEGSEEGATGIFELGQQIRFRVESVGYSKPTPVTPASLQRPSGMDVAAPTLDSAPCMQVVGSVNDHGLGLVCWNWE